MPSESLKSLLERYGDVDRVIPCTSRDKEFKNVPIDEAIAIMVVNDHIPSSLWIKETQQYMFFSYNKQPFTCLNCGSLEHRASACDVFRNTPSEDRANAVNIDIDEDATGGNSPTTDTEDDNVPAEANDSGNENNSDSDGRETESDNENEDSDTDQENPFECTECDYKCNTGHELNDHIQTHKTWADRAKSPSMTHSRGFGFSASQPNPSSRSQHSADAKSNKRGASVSPSSTNKQNRKSKKKSEITRNVFEWDGY